MSVKEEVQSNQSKALELSELSQYERMVLQMFRQLDEQGRKDIIRFLDVLLASQ
ncbi:Uncharacterised protein [Pseudomonas putida]|nr:Uncharacterised protein [Pseudomonas putida]CAB5650447.1 Uncharacterised protein [Pseudomonas putida]CAB5721358.1 Uncharacterised protein [Pseudomonas putida]CAB5723718.1 Uncharacterised protein [Pseudomonas putida]CAC9678893.1 Uncharacterised protein [Pseudomonas putida]